MKKQLLFLLITFQLLQSQQVSYAYDTRINFIFEEDNKKGTSLEFNSKDSKTPIIAKTYLWKTESSSNHVNFPFLHNGETYKMNGELVGNKYFNANGYATFTKESGDYSFKKVTDSLYDYNEFKDLEKIVAELENGTSIEVFTRKLNDGIDYSPATNSFIKDIYRVAPPLELGECVVYFALKTKKGYLFPIFTTVEKINDDVFFDNEQIKAVIEDNYRAFSEKRDDDNAPGFCYVTSPAQDAEENTKEFIDEFLAHMCELDMIWKNKLKKGEYNSIYLGEMNRKYQLYKNHKVLSPKQVEIYKRELLNYLPEK